MYSFVVRFRAKAGTEEGVRQALEELTQPSRNEPGCMAYLPSIQTDDPSRFVVYERYVDQEAFEAHKSSPHYLAIAPERLAPNVEDREFIELEAVEPNP